MSMGKGGPSKVGVVSIGQSLHFRGANIGLNSSRIIRYTVLSLLNAQGSYLRLRVKGTGTLEQKNNVKK